MDLEFKPFPKIKRFSREVIITEKIDGTNASVYIDESGSIKAASRTRWITPDNDNYGFAKWVHENSEELLKLGPGHHFGEWWGKGIQRGYSQTDKKFSLFNVSKWEDNLIRPSCCSVVPLLGTLNYPDHSAINEILENLRLNGSTAAPGFMSPEGIIIYHTAANVLFKKTLDNDDKHKFE